jgi:aspartyl-tRNA(Asn)/glutamyl-tRNA(Gln) amidotransferase subunit A
VARSPHSLPVFSSIVETARLLRRKDVSPRELVDASLERIEQANPALNAFITVLADAARRRAAVAEREILRGDWRGPLHGIPISLKDNFLTRGVRTTAGSRILFDFVPAEDSYVATALARAGAILIGKTNMHEFAYGITNESSCFGPVHNPWALERISGGSSGGSAAAVATGMCFASMGTDTGGSIRIPSALCGVVGIKPSYGLIDLAGVIPLSVSGDHAGPMARSVADASIVLEAVAGKYPRGKTRPDFRKLKGSRSRRLTLRLGWPKDYYFELVDGGVRQAIKAAAKVFRSMGARVMEIPLPHLAGSMADATNQSVGEATYYHEQQGYYPARAAEYTEDVRERLHVGHELRAADFLRSGPAIARIAADFAAAFEHVDAILAPASAIPATPIGQTEVSVRGQNVPVRSTLLRATRPTNVTGLPSLSIPCGFTAQGLPVGLQLIGPRYSEARLLTIAATYEEATEWHLRRPGETAFPQNAATRV